MSKLMKFSQPHINSFNAFLHNISNLLSTIQIQTKISNTNVTFRFLDVEFRNREIYTDPSAKIYQALLKMEDYVVDLFITVQLEIFNTKITDKDTNSDTEKRKIESKKIVETVYFGEFPIMVKSDICATKNLKPNSLDPKSLGGYFILNGTERIFRFLFARKSNTPLFLKLGVKGKHIYEIFVRTVKNGVGHRQYILFNSNGLMFYKLIIEKVEYEIPIVFILKGLGLTDKEIFDRILDERIYNWLSIAEDIDYNLYLKDRFNIVSEDFFSLLLIHLNSDTYKITTTGTAFDDKNINVENNNYTINKQNLDKANFICSAIKELYLRIDANVFDDVDSLSNQEILTEYEMFSSIFYNRLLSTFKSLKFRIRETEIIRYFFNSNSTKPLENVLKSTEIGFKEMFSSFIGFGNYFKMFFKTGRLQFFKYSSDIQHTTGLCLIMENVNFYRYISYLMQISRGTFLQTLGTSSVRKLRSESYGFLCCIHTPDGLPCGILNHLSLGCEISNSNTALFAISQTADGNFNNNIDMIFTENSTVLEAKLERIKHETRLVNDKRDFIELLYELGMTRGVCSNNSDRKLVVLDGLIVGVSDVEIIWKLRTLRSINLTTYLLLTQIGCDNSEVMVNHADLIQQYKNSSRVSYLFEVFQRFGTIQINTKCSRFIRKVKSKYGFDYISPTEQMELYILPYNSDGINAADSDIVLQNENKHIMENRIMEYTEMSSIHFLGFHAAQIPFSDQSPSPRMIYQCGMQKQSIGLLMPVLNASSVNTNPVFWSSGNNNILNKEKKNNSAQSKTPLNNHIHNNILVNNDPKKFGLFYTQKPLISTSINTEYDLDNFGFGLNISIGILSYSSYDMEDALIINKKSVDLGLFDCMVYKTVVEEAQGVTCPLNIGDKIEPNAILFYKLNVSNTVDIIRYDGIEVTYVHAIRSLPNKCAITLKERRRVSVGDKFSSRHGQKGICSSVYDERNMPFGELGLDLIINPNAFPSRMTIGMLVECIASIGCVSDVEKFNSSVRELNKRSGKNQYSYTDANTPFCFYYANKMLNSDTGQMLNSEIRGNTKEEVHKNAVDFFVKLIESNCKGGFSKDSSQCLYSGFLGNPLIDYTFSGFVFYQRLRHMVSDKYQVRALGPVDSLTKQPIRGRTRNGGIRFGEMERDCLIAHGGASILFERLCKSSDGEMTRIPKCGDFECREAVCYSEKEIMIPAAFRYLVAELAGMGVKTRLF
ncbi:DNA-directed RNA polymerase I subunit rpa2 [Cucumispora dikerogammari]|nr:DNA-directed RNA polymerase I subunit rpa2 [Cucumispora dikerogammari]